MYSTVCFSFSLSLPIFMAFLPTAAHSVSHFAQLKFTFILARSVCALRVCSESKRYGRLYIWLAHLQVPLLAPLPHLCPTVSLCLISSHIACDTDSTFAHLLVSLLKLILQQSCRQANSITQLYQLVLPSCRPFPCPARSACLLWALFYLFS